MRMSHNPHNSYIRAMWARYALRFALRRVLAPRTHGQAVALEAAKLLLMTLALFIASWLLLVVWPGSRLPR